MNGWKLVPSDPTTDMLSAMAECDGYLPGDRDRPGLTRWEDYWRMALSAAPPAPVEPVAIVRVWNQGGSGEFRTAEGINRLAPGTLLYTHPPACPDMAEVERLMHNIMDSSFGRNTSAMTSARIALLDYLHPFCRQGGAR